MDNMPLKNVSFSPFTMAVPKSLPCTHHSHAMFVEVAEKPSDPANNVLNATIELRIRQRYALFIEPIEGCVVAADDEVIESAELCFQFKIPIFLLCPISLPKFNDYVSGKLRQQPISLDLCDYLKPYIQLSAAAVAEEIGFKKEFKLIFVANVVKYDLANKQECDKMGLLVN